MSTRSSLITVALPAVLAIAFVGVLVTLLSQRAEMNQIQAEYQKLLQESRAARFDRVDPGPLTQSPTPTSEPSPDPMPDLAASPGESGPPPDLGGPEVRHPRVSAARPAPQMFGPIQSTGLELGGTHVTPHEGGLRATMKFFPTESESPGLVSVVVRLPGDSDSQILDLQPAGEGMQFSDVRARVAKDGKFAVWQGTAASADSLEIALTVSGDAVAEVRGTAGIGPFDLEIGATEAVVTPK